MYILWAMRIVMLSINPLFKNKVNGGSAKQLKNIAKYLGEMGHNVIILATKRSDTKESFYWQENVIVKPSLEFKQPFPEPYNIPAYKMVNNIYTVLEHLKSADRLYIHDGEFLFPPICDYLPTVISLRDNAYPETMLGSLILRSDSLITISDYSHKIVLATAGRFYPDLYKRTITIPNGIDFQLFRPKEISLKLKEIIPVDTTKHTIVLHPHRPEKNKGLMQTVDVVDKLVHDYKISNILALVPNWFDTKISPDVQTYLAEVHQYIKNRGLKENFFFHEWLPQSLMPDYYNLGDVMLALGSFVEAFGNTVHESLACGTPAIVAQVGPYRDLLPESLLPKVNYNDAETAAKLAAQILQSDQKSFEGARAFLQENYNIDSQVSNYAKCILSAQKLPTLDFQSQALAFSSNTLFNLAPWCYIWENSIYHDFLAKRTKISDLASLLKERPLGFSVENAQHVGISQAEVTQWLYDGYIVPL